MTALWKWKSFFTLLTISCTLGFIYFFPYSENYLRTLDSFVFTKAHQAIQFSPYLQTFLILASHELSHFIFLGISCIIWIFWIKNHPKHLIDHKIGEAIFSLAAIGFTLYFINHLFFHDWMQFTRIPPKFTNPLSNMFLEISNWVHKKKSLDLVYPNYYATGIIQYIIISMICLGLRRGIINLLIGLYFLLPLIFMGQYGVSDLLIGTTSIGFFTTALFYYTPLYYVGVHLIEKIVTKIHHLNLKNE